MTTVDIPTKIHRKLKREAVRREIDLKDLIAEKLSAIVIISMLAIGGLGLAYADNIDLPLDEPYDDTWCVFLAAGDHVKYTCNWTWFLPDYVMAEINQTEVPALISQMPEHNLGLADKIRLFLESPPEIDDPMDLDFQEFLHPEVPLTFEERKIQDSINKLDECLRGLGAWQAYQAQTDIEYFVDESRYSFAARDNLSQNIHIKRILLAIEECDIMRTYERMHLIGAYELNKVLADIAGVDYLGRGAEHPLAQDVTDQDQTGMVHTDPVTAKDLQQEIDEAQRYLDEEAPWIDPTEGCIFREDDPDRCVNRGGQPAGLKCQAAGQPTELGEYPAPICPMDDYNRHILENFDSITYENILEMQCDAFLGIYDHKRFTDEFPKWLDHCPIEDEDDD